MLSREACQVMLDQDHSSSVVCLHGRIFSSDPSDFRVGISIKELNNNKIVRENFHWLCLGKVETIIRENFQKKSCIRAAEPNSLAGSSDRDLGKLVFGNTELCLFPE